MDKSMAFWESMPITRTFRSISGWSKHENGRLGYWRTLEKMERQFDGRPFRYRDYVSNIRQIHVSRKLILVTSASIIVLHGDNRDGTFGILIVSAKMAMLLWLSFLNLPSPYDFVQYSENLADFRSFWGISLHKIWEAISNDTLFNNRHTPTSRNLWIS